MAHIITGVDRLAKLVDEQEDITVGEAAQRLEVGTTIIEEWAEFLEQEGYIDVQYGFSKTHLCKADDRDYEEERVTGNERLQGLVHRLEAREHALETDRQDLDSLRSEFSALAEDLEQRYADVQEHAQAIEQAHDDAQAAANQAREDDKQFRKQQRELHKKLSSHRESARTVIDELSDACEHAREVLADKQSSQADVKQARHDLAQLREALKSQSDDLADARSSLKQRRQALSELRGRVERQRDEVVVPEPADLEQSVSSLRKQLTKQSVLLDELRADVQQRVESFVRMRQQKHAQVAAGLELLSESPVVSLLRAGEQLRERGLHEEAAAVYDALRVVFRSSSGDVQQRVHQRVLSLYESLAQRSP